MKLHQLPFVAALALLSTVACDSPTGIALPTVPSPAPLPAGVFDVASVNVTGVGVLAAGASAQFSAIAMLPDGSAGSVTSRASWYSSDPKVIIVSNTGLVSVVGSGTADIIAAFQEKTGKLTVSVGVPCVTGVTPLALPYSAGSASAQQINVTAPIGCQWVAQSNAPFVELSASGSFSDKVAKSGSTSVGFRVLANTSAVQRAAVITIEGFQVNITQDNPRISFLRFTSDAGDTVGSGQTFYAETPATSISVNFTDLAMSRLSASTNTWHLDLQGVQSPVTPLLAGPYPNVGRYGFQPPTVPGLWFWSPSSNCATVTGRFDILEAVYRSIPGLSPVVVRLGVTFEQHCNGVTPALRGELSINR